MNAAAPIELNAARRREIVGWIDANLSSLPESVRMLLLPQRKYLAAGRDLRKQFEASNRELLRAMGIVPSSERRRSGHPLASLPKERATSQTTVTARLAAQRDRSDRLGEWHSKLHKHHLKKSDRLKERLATMASMKEGAQGTNAGANTTDVTEETPVEAIELTAAEQAEPGVHTHKFVEHLEMGDGADPVLATSCEVLMPGGALLSEENQQSISVDMPPELFDAAVDKVLTDKRVRYDFSVAVRRIELDVEKKVVVGKDGKRTVVSASTAAYGPSGYSVTWSALATLAVMVGQFAIPLNRLATMLSTAGKVFRAGSLSRMLHYVAMRFLPIYLELAEQLADSPILAGDDTSCRVVEVASYFKQKQAPKPSSADPKPPWQDYETKTAAEASIQACEERAQARQKRRADGDRHAKRTADETPSLGMLIGRHLNFVSPRQDGQGQKQSMNTTVLSGRSVADDPRSMIIFYRSHLGSLGNLLESILHHRKPRAGDVSLQSDLSTTNLIRDPQLLDRFTFTLTGCLAHARRPFALYEHEDPVYCPYMLHLFAGLAMHEERLTVHGRNHHNVLAVRQAESRQLWEAIKGVAEEMKQKWSKATKLGTAARYILNHFEKLTAYLDDPRLEATNNLRERMLRTEKLIEGSSLFRRSLEGRFVLDIVRTMLQTAVAASVPVHEYLLSVLTANPTEVAKHPEQFTPHAWAARQAGDSPNSPLRVS